LIFFLLRRGHWEPDKRLARRLPRITVAALVMAAALIPAAGLLADWSAGALWQRIVGILILVFGGMAVYGGVVLAIGGAGLSDLKRLARRGRKPAPVEADGD